MDQTVDPQIKNLVQAIGQTETGGESDPYNAKGASGEFGRYQFMPDTYKEYAQKYLGDSNAAPTVENQNRIAYSFVKEKKDSGYNPAQIASMWNAGESKPDAYKENYQGTNAEGVAYNTPAYVQKVSNYYKQYSSGQQPDSSDQTQPTDQQTQQPTDQTQEAPKPTPDLLQQVGNVVNAIFPGKEVGQSIGTLAGFIAAKVHDAVNGTNTASYYDTSAPTPLQTAADIGQGALAVGGLSEVVGASSVAGKIGTAALEGGVYGGLNAVARGSKNAGEITKQAAIGGALGGATGGLVEGGKALYSAFSPVATRTASELGALVKDPTFDESTLKPEERANYYQQKNAAASDALNTKIKQDEDALANKLTAQKIAVGDTSKSEAQALIDPAKKLYTEKSNQYVAAVNDALDNAENKGFQKNVTETDLNNQIDTNTPEDDKNNIADKIKADLGLNKPPAPQSVDPETGLPIIPTEATPEKTITTEDILKTAKGYIQQISKNTLGGNKVFSLAEYEIMQKYSILMKVLDDNGVDLSKANKIWSDWAPLRKAITTQIRPFDTLETVGIRKQPVAKTLITANKTATTESQSLAKSQAQDLISKIEKELGMTKGALGKDTADALASVDKTKLDQIDAATVAKKAKADLARKGMNTRYDAKIKGDATIAKKAAIKKAVLIALGILGAGEIAKHAPVIAGAL